ncbi:MAG: GAF domain-containing protein, partial [Ekhidna sp.]|nr:GAF domain-containing protein [Ekhidna sp.]
MGPKDEALRSALERCENEPIRIPGNIQDFGYLLVLDENFEIIEVSENLDKIIEDIHSLANLPLSEFIDRDYVKKLKANLLEGELNPIRHTEVKIQTSSHSGVYDAMIHKAGDKIILELEEKVNTADEQFVYNIYAQLMAFNNKLQMTETKDELYQHLVETFRSVTGLDRVKLYAFDDEWNGEIVAEEKEPFMNSYMGLHFPSSDIPAQARELYKSNYLRIIYDIDAKPSPLVNLIEGKKEIETDLSHAVLRSVSPIHLQYLKNMGVQASMSVSLLQKGELWGMIVAHHNTSYKPPYQIRMIADLIGQNFSAFLTSHAEKSRLDLEKVISTSLSEMEKALRQPGSLSQMLKDNEKLLLSIVKADGVLACLNNTCYIFGKVPKLDQLSSFISWLEENHTDECFQTNQFGKELPDGIRETLDTCGLMITPVSSRMSDYLVWFRDEKVKKTNWAGKHEKNVKKDSVGYYLTPRASFSRYVEEHRGISEEWANEEVITAKFLSKIILNRHHEGEIERVSEDLNDFIKHSTSAIYITSKSGVIAKVNETFAQLVNKSVVKLTGTRLSDHFRADVCEQHFEQIDKLAQEQETNTFKFHHTP